MDQAITQECAERRMENLEIDIERVNFCVLDSFETFGDHTTTNDILRLDRDNSNNLGITMSPTVAINGHVYHGHLDASTIFSHLCRSYKLEHRPRVCAPNFDI
mmetsp:Transcript_889/g.1212  ORF Transcript_889/g.1212 Transcript_889/m.1212 type:complete len:103 (+) Transcript_889:1014-1322(+)